MVRVVDRSLLTKAKKNKNDEFYTQRVDIDKELPHYSHHFKGKTVYCNTDNPLLSNFFKYFYDNFESLGLKKLIATGYALDDEKQGTFFSFTGKDEERQAYEAGEIELLEDDGDFRSPECIKLLKEADIVVTNPPYSLLREFIGYMTSYRKDFLIIATVNAITYKDVFKHIQDGKVWLGVGLGRDISGFIVPEHYELYGTEARINENGERIVATNSSLWLTTLDLEKRHKDIPLVNTYEGNESDYPTYDNLNGINVNKTKDIPSDYYGLMGVPITFLHKHNPEQFDIIRFRKGDDGKDLRINGKSPYFRIIIRRKTENSSEQDIGGDLSLSSGQTLIF
ncbi:adenine-specific methyltransferase EcoRI family protein [Rhodococcus pyridinivorans]|uniref:adenine-specific methyltransferase EcoRI family protein n=1 Tax=Rhodococcus pyridinivorans TaxID=103816 RepID=UPI001903DC49|nr:adenine-specific methyltransferase EcoRI family protein [Rhodococcus pyridinivorans]QQM55643.1 adenosine deaminase [Rhodococcus pyridinivorans]